MSATTVSERILKKQLEKALSKVENERIKQLLLEHLSTAMAKLPSGRRNRQLLTGTLPTIPERFLADLGQRRWRKSDPQAAKQLAYIYERTVSAFAKGHILEGAKPGFAKRFEKMLWALHDQQPAITESTDLVHLMTTIAKHEGKKLARGQFKHLLQELASKAAEDSAIYHPAFLADVAEAVEDMKRFAGNSKQLAHHDLASLDLTPLIFTNFRAPGSSGPTEARFLYIDLGVAFTGRSRSDQTRYVMSIKAQIKLWMVETLVSHTDASGKERIGQLLNDELRSTRGAWRLHEARIPREAIIDDPRIRKLISMGSRDFTDQERAALAKDGIKVKHILHEVPYRDFYDWAHRALKEANVTLAP
jgi:hypothetical protein